MSCQEDVVKIGKKLEKMISNKAEDSVVAMDLLTTLRKLPMTLDVLQKTRIGMTVNNFRKTTKSDDVISLSKSLIKNWKKLLAEGNSGGSGLSRSSSVASNMSKDGEDSRDSGEGSEDKKEKKEESKASNSDEEKASSLASQSSFKSTASDTTDSLRLKCRELLASSLQASAGCEGAVGTPEEVAASIEECIFSEFKRTDSKYKNRVRSRVSNLKDPKNPLLREGVLTGGILPERMATMTAVEMANDDLKKARAEFTKQAINDHQLAQAQGTTTDLLKCGKCGKRKCSYTQAQTRSADEPMTTFVLCLDCGHRWKFC